MPEIYRDGAVVHYLADGDGPPLVMLHGFTGSAAGLAWLAAAFAPRRRVLRPDLLGHGRSGLPADPARYGLWPLAEDVLAIADGAGLERFDLFGYSLGGRVALRVALRAGARVSRLVLESTSPGIADAAARAARRESDLALVRLLEEEGIAAFVRRWEDLPLFHTQRRLPEATRAAQRAARLACRPEGLAQSLRGAGAGASDDVLPRLGGIRAPTLLVGGCEDERYRQVLAEMADRLPEASLRLVEGAGHNVHLERPEEFVRLIADFLEENADSRMPRLGRG